MAVLPGSTLGILGGGQLGRMFVTAARTMGYEVIVLDPDSHSPAGSMATRHLAASYDDVAALDELARDCAVITTEFENIPATALRRLARSRPVHPSADALEITQNRIREKTFIQSLGLATAPFAALHSLDDLNALQAFEFPAIVKTATLGYDGKGQIVCHDLVEVRRALQQLDRECILEQFVDLEREVSVVLARGESGETACFPAAENRHANGILDVSLVPAGITPELEEAARQAAQRIAAGLDYCGVLAVEFFVSRTGELLVNEIAPRPHNSGHYTLDACFTSQFEQQVRMICGLPAGNCQCHTPVVMLNLLGDIWPQDAEPAWDQVLAVDHAHLHLYGKKEPRRGRKMGHINLLADSPGDALQGLERIRQFLQLGAAAKKT